MKQFIKDKKVIIALFSVCIIIVASLGIKNRLNTKVKNNDEVKYFEVKEESGFKFKGRSSISKEQNIMIDKSKGEINAILAEDNQRVKKGTVLIRYYNKEANNQVEDLNRQISKLNSDIKSQSNKVAQKGMVDELKNNLKDLISQRNNSKKDIYKYVTAEMDGIVYIDENGQNDNSKPFMKIVSSKPIVVCQASEFDVELLKVDEPVKINVISNGKNIGGKITKINYLPIEGAGDSSSMYQFEIKPDRKIRIGFSVEVTVNPKNIKIPKECVFIESGKTYVKASDEVGKLKNIEIKASLEGDDYNLKSNSVKPGDKLIINPLDEAKGE